MVGTAPALQPIKSEDAKSGYNFLLKGVIIGAAGVGKTALLQRFTNDSFNPVYVQTIGIDFAVTSFCSPDGDNIKVQLWDTAGNERFRTITNSYYRGSHGIMVVFDVGDESSFNLIGEETIREVQAYTAEDTPMILVGNKSDIGDTREVSREKAETFAKANGMQYVETSAKDNEYVQFAFALAKEGEIFSTFDEFKKALRGMPPRGKAFVEAMLALQKKRRAEVKENPMTKKLDKKMKKEKASSSGETSAETKSKSQTKSSTCTII